MSSSFYQESSSGNPGSRPSLLPPRQAYSFPVLKADEIVKCLNELGISVALDDLQNPEKSKDTYKRILEVLAEICTGISREELCQPSQNGLHYISYQQIHEESIPQISLFRSCVKMMETCEVQDFTIKDYIYPTPNRLRRHLSGIMNFAKFREERLVLLGDLSATREELLERLNELKDVNDLLNNRLSLLREQTSEESKMIADLEEECKSMEHSILSLNKEQEAIREESVILKTKNADLKESLTKAISIAEEDKATLEMLSGQIVSSPEKFRKKIIEVGQVLQAEQRDIKIADRKIRDLSAWVVNVDESQREVSGVLEAVQDIKVEVDRQKAVLSDLDQQKQLIAQSKVALSELDQTVHQLHRQAGRAEEKLQVRLPLPPISKALFQFSYLHYFMFHQHLKKQAAFRGEDTQKSVEHLHQQLKNAESLRSQMRSQLDRAEGEAVRIERECAAEQEAHEQSLADIVASYSRLERMVVNHLKGLQRVIGAGEGQGQGHGQAEEGNNVLSLTEGDGPQELRELQMMLAMETMNVKMEMDLAAATAAVVEAKSTMT